MKAALSIFIVILGVLPVYGQNEDVLNNFSATEFNGNIFLDWSISQGNTCNGITILHSLDSVNFTQIGNIEGICGSAAEIVYYDFTHPNVEENVTHYYKLQLGGFGFSWIIDLDVFYFGEDNYRLGPNPLSDDTRLTVANENHVELSLYIYNLKGDQLSSKTTTETYFTLSKTDYPVGKYLFIISQEGSGEDIKGEFVVD